ncbi:hypothetical protein P7K49_011982, partial [Saguinus oedipus]
YLGKEGKMRWKERDMEGRKEKREGGTEEGNKKREEGRREKKEGGRKEASKEGRKMERTHGERTKAIFFGAKLKPSPSARLVQIPRSVKASRASTTPREPSSRNSI